MSAYAFSVCLLIDCIQRTFIFSICKLKIIFSDRLFDIVRKCVECRFESRKKNVIRIHAPTQLLWKNKQNLMEEEEARFLV